MKELFQTIKALLDHRQPMVLITITASTGSTPRRAGSKMLMGQEGRLWGTIGGGAVEYQAMEIAREMLEKKTSCSKRFSLTRGQAADIGMVCGGEVRLYLQYISWEREEMLPLCVEILDRLEQRRESWLVWEIGEAEDWKMAISDAPRMGRQRENNRKEDGKGEDGGKWYYEEPLLLPGRVFIFGGGHVAQELVPLLSHLDFCCVVMDDRQEFANKNVFPQAEKTIVGDLEHISSWVDIQSEDYVCIMTRGHQYDYYVQKQVMPLQPCYIGVMGSRNKIRVVSEKLREDGFSEEMIRSCHMPIGTRIEAETPAEIAVSIAGELIAARAKRTGIQ